MGWAIGALISRTGLSEKAARLILTAGLFLAVLAVISGMVALYNHRVINRYQQQQETRARPATERAATERARDEVTAARREEHMREIVDAQPDQPIAPTSLARGCEQLRRSGRSPLPAACGSSGSR